MADFKTADEQKAKYIEAMGAELGSVYQALWQEVAWLHNKWGEYVVLYGTRPSRIDLLNEAAPLFFRIVEDTLWEDTLLHIARLTDPPRSAGRETLTIQMLPGLISNPDIKSLVRSRVTSTIELADFSRDWRNRRIAHRDLQLSLQQEAKPLEAASRKKVNKALESIASVLNAISLRYLDSTTIFEPHNIRGAEQLLYVIKDGLRTKKERQERILRGELHDEDLGPRSI